MVQKRISFTQKEATRGRERLRERESEREREISNVGVISGNKGKKFVILNNGVEINSLVILTQF